MSLSLLQLPHELLIQIFAALPTKALLRFAQTCHHARSLAYSNLHTLFLTIAPCHRYSQHKGLFSTQHESNPRYHPSLNQHKVLIRIHEAWDFTHSTLLTFHTKITSHILTRHACTLQTLDLTLWALSVPIAQALTKLSALRALSLRIENAQAVSRAHVLLQHSEERQAWGVLVSTPRFARQVHSLEIENAEISTAQLCALLSRTEKLRELRLSRCDMLTSGMWDTAGLGLDVNLTTLQRLGVRDCMNVHITEFVLEKIGRMRGLQSLDLRGCSGLAGEVLEQWNRDVWHVPEFLAPRACRSLKETDMIEVDPEYLLEGED